MHLGRIFLPTRIHHMAQTQHSKLYLQALSALTFLIIHGGVLADAGATPFNSNNTSTTATERVKENHTSASSPSSRKSSSTASPTVLPEIGVSSTRIKQHAITINPTQTITTIEAKELERTQPTTIFEAIRDTPGVAIEGGPRPSGMTFNVRGFNSNEDVQVRVDNVPKGFEKYRFGGTFIEPDLLKSIEVQRGPQIASGSGSLGGTILAKTKDAADLLKPGRRYGGRIKLGYASNNDEVQRSYLAFARPVDAVDILYNRTYRNSNDITHSDGSKLPQSKVNSRAQLLKVGIFPTDFLELITSVTLLEESGLQPYDALTSDPGLSNFGNVLRDIEDLSIAHTAHWNPEYRWIDLSATVAFGHTKVLETYLPGMSRNRSCGLQGVTFCGNDYHDQKVKGITLELTNTAQLYKQDNFSISLLTGLQYRSMENETRRTTDSQGPNINESFPADGFWAASTSGENAYTAAFIQSRIQYGRLGIIPGVRVDWYEISSTEDRVKRHLAEKGLSSEIDFDHTSYSMGLTFDAIANSLTFFANYGEGFRPPSINDYFTYGDRAGTPPKPANWLPNRPWLGEVGLGPPYSSGEGRCNTLETNFLCGDVFKIQSSQSSEIGAHYQTPNLFGKNIQLMSKFTYFHIETKHLLRYFSIDDLTNTYVPQDGWEKRNGTEFEGSLFYKDSYFRANYSRTWGSYFNPQTGNVSSIAWVPANTLNLTIGTQLTSRVGINASYRKVSERPLINGDTQDGYELFSAGGFWSPTDNLTFRIIGENITNKDYHLNGGGDFSGLLGNRGPGRSIRLITEITF